MVSVVTQGFEEVATRVASWPTTDQLALVQRILELRSKLPSLQTAQILPNEVFNIVKDLPRPAVSEPARTKSLEHVIGVLRIAKPPTDAECEQILAEERMRKYG